LAKGENAQTLLKLEKPTDFQNRMTGTEEEAQACQMGDISINHE